MRKIEKTSLILFLVTLLIGCCADFFDIAWGTGIWLGEMALTWAILFVLFCIAASIVVVLLARTIWYDSAYTAACKKMIQFRHHLRWGKWILAVIVFIFPIWFFQFTVIGIVFQGLFLRASLWTLELFLLGFLFSTGDEHLVDWKEFIFLLILTAAAFSIFSALRFVTAYPFSLGWSEGNRLWDYSILFGRGRYDYPAAQKIDVLLDVGRQFVGGLPFLVPGLDIRMERMWVGLTTILPYLLLGLAAFRFIRNKYDRFAAVLWTYLFLNQGPIHPPLVLYAALVAMAWRTNLLLSIPLVVLTSYATYHSRYTWTFAPFMWFFTFEFMDAARVEGKRFQITSRFRTLLMLGISVLIGGFLFLGLVSLVQPDLVVKISGAFSGLAISPDSLLERLSQQPLLWYRLLPNETYGSGVLIGMIVATLPLILILLHLQRSKIWVVHTWQKWEATLSLLAFLAVGLIISAKIGGGGDLHNLDMYLISLFFLAVAAIQNGGMTWLMNSRAESLWVRVLLILLFVIPAVGPLREMRSYNFTGSAAWLMALKDAPNVRALGMYPSQVEIDKSLGTIQDEVDIAKGTGGVLFMDQRQLLTFGYIQNVPLVPEYDKKVLIENALTANAGYFMDFYSDLEKKRFSLIITQPLNTPKKGSEYQFGEENDAWVGWVAKPLLCYYEIKQTLINVNVQLLVPRTGAINCSKDLPW